MVFIVDDDPSVREALQWLFESVRIPTRTYVSAREFLDSVHDDVPGCLILDVRMPGMSGLQLQAYLAERGFIWPVIILTAHGDVEMAVRAMKTGAVDFIKKPFGNQELLETVRRHLMGSAERFGERELRRQIQGRFETLSQRERAVLNEIVGGFSSKEIARKLGISPRTVDVHRSHIMKKMQVSTVNRLISTMASFRSEAS